MYGYKIDKNKQLKMTCKQKFELVLTGFLKIEVF